MFKLLMIALVMVLFFGCTQNTITNSTPHNRFKIGQKWSYQRFMILISDSGQKAFDDDTIGGYFNYNAVAETLINDKVFTIVNCDFYDIGAFDVSPFTERCAVYWGVDSVLLYTFRDGVFLPPGGLFKTNSNYCLTPSISQSNYYKHLLAAFSKKRGLAKSNNDKYDTTVFNDFTTLFIFSLKPGQSYYYRTDGDPHGNLWMRRTYIGKENVNVPAGQFYADKFKIELEEVFGDSFDIHGMIGLIWTTDSVKIKEYYDFGKEDWTDEIGNKLGTFSSTDCSEYLGPYNINPDTVKPRHQISTSDKEFADLHFSLDKYIAWKSFIDSASYMFINMNLFYFRSDDDSFFIEEAGKKSNTYYNMISKHNQYVQGWDDANPNMVVDSFRYIKNQNFGTNWDRYYRGLAINAIIQQNGQPVDTLWMYYKDSAKTIPYIFGKSDHQLEFYIRIYDLGPVLY